MSGYQYIPEEQEGQVRTDEQSTPTTELQRNEKTFDAAHPQVAQPGNPTPAATAKKVQTHQVKQMQEGEDEPREKAVHDAYPTDI